jgi:3-oxoacyl-[acyl-carrier-protein] synthase II
VGANGGGVSVVYGSANSSLNLDACELDVLMRVFGEAAGGINLLSIKGAIGEFGAAGALTAVATCLGLRDGMVPPLCNLRRPPADAPFRFARAAEARDLSGALMTSTARGGSSIALLFYRPPR